VRSEPSLRELRVIESEWPVIEAELDVVAAECRLASRPGDQVAIRTHRRAVRALLAVLTDSVSPTPLDPFNPMVTGSRPDAA